MLLVERTNQAQVERRKLLDKLKDKPCMDCGGRFPPCAMDWDHRDPTEKKYHIGAIKYASMKLIMAELKKCDLVCANCHRIRTWICRPETRLPGNPLLTL